MDELRAIINGTEETNQHRSCLAGQTEMDIVASQRADVTLFWKSPFGEPESRFVVDRARF